MNILYEVIRVFVQIPSLLWVAVLAGAALNPVAKFLSLNLRNLFITTACIIVIIFLKPDVISSSIYVAVYGFLLLASTFGMVFSNPFVADDEMPKVKEMIYRLLSVIIVGSGLTCFLYLYYFV